MNCLLLPENSALTLNADSPKVRHIKNVLKMSDGDEIFVGKKNGNLWVCTLKYADDGSIEFKPLRDVPTPECLDVGIAISFARPQIAQRILFEAACLGVRHLIFYPATKGEADYAKSSLYAKGEFYDWLEKGAEQACITTIPKFEICQSLANALTSLENAFPNALRLAPDVYEATDTLSGALEKNLTKTATLVLGSERGFTNADRNTLRDSNYTLVSLGKRVMRTDSAFIASCAILSAFFEK